MSELLSILFAAIFSSSMGLSPAGAGNTDAEQNSEKMRQSNARANFKLAENKANADYKASIIDCKKKTSLDKKTCLEEAKSLNEKTIGAAKQTADMAMSNPATQ